MKTRPLSAFVVAVALAAAAFAQDAGSPPLAGQNSGQNSGSGNGGGYGQRGGRGGGMGMLGRGLMGTVTDVAADHYTIKTDAGDVYTVHFSANTRILKQAAGMHERGERGQAGQGGEGGGNPPETLKPTDIKVGDAIVVMGEIDAAAKSVGATVVLRIDPERAKEMREMQANYGKTWLMGKVTAIDGVKVTIMGAIDNAAHVCVADENTTFRKRREPITLADIQVGDTVRVEGAVKDGVFLATAVNAVGAQGPPPTVPRDTAVPPQPK